MKKVLIGVHFRDHNANISIYDGKGFHYFLLDRAENELKNSKVSYPNMRHATEWPNYDFEGFLSGYLKLLNINKEDVFAIAVGDSYWNFVCDDGKSQKTGWLSNICDNVIFVDHHYAHHLSNFENKNSWVLDGHGNELRYSTIFKDANIIETLRDPEDGESFGVMLEMLGLELTGQPFCAGHMMALDSLGICDYGYLQKHFNDTIKNSKVYHHRNRSYLSWLNLKQAAVAFERDYIKTQHELAKITHHNYIKKFFKKKDHFIFTGGVAQSIILNTHLKSIYKNMEVLPHGYDGGISLGLIYYLIEKYNYDLPNLSKFPFIQADEHPGLPSKQTIKNTAEELANGKIVLWYQENGELGPRALGNRSILANPLIPDMKEQVNNKVKKRAWYRPYGASVMVDNYKEYFDLDWESPYMLYQANVKDPEKLKPITHFDGTCRIQTVNQNHEIFYELLEEFKKLTGVPILLNTSFNLPGKPIVGTKKNAKLTFDSSQADILVTGDDFYKK